MGADRGRRGPRGLRGRPRRRWRTRPTRPRPCWCLRGPAAAHAPRVGRVRRRRGPERPAGDWHAEWQPLRTMLRLAGAAAERTCAARAGDDVRRRRDGPQPRPCCVAARPRRRLGRRADRARRRLVDRVLARHERLRAMTRRAGAPRGRSADAPVVVLGPSLGTTWEMWDAARRALLGRRYRVVRYDTRGHGRSPVPAGPYAVASWPTTCSRWLDGLGARPRSRSSGCRSAARSRRRSRSRTPTG